MVSAGRLLSRTSRCGWIPGPLSVAGRRGRSSAPRRSLEAAPPRGHPVDTAAEAQGPSGPRNRNGAQCVWPKPLILSTSEEAIQCVGVKGTQNENAWSLPPTALMSSRRWAAANGLGPGCPQHGRGSPPAVGGSAAQTKRPLLLSGSGNRSLHWDS